jgi:alkyl sulfatase BDS1-like metallo-beta-lactamase superfamily hydrolase
MKKMNPTWYMLLLFSIQANAQYNRIPKDASTYTIAANKKVRYESGLDFYSRTDSLDAWRGAIKVWPNLKIYSGPKDTAWDMEKFAFLNTASSQNAPATINPSLWRQAKLNYIPGIFKVDSAIYQARGFDLSNVTFIQGRSGWIVIDPLVTRETAKAALDSLNSVLKVNRKVSAVIFTHSHIDHYGGILGVTDNFLPDASIYAPSGFLEHAVSENTIAGNVMGRRAAYMYGSLYPRGNKHMVDAGLGKGISTGISGIVAKNIPVAAGILSPQVINIDGLEVRFWSSPGAEAPVEMMFYFPLLKALCTSEEVTHTMHNVYSLRGAKVRDALGWSKFIDSTLTVYGGNAKVVFASHHWPVWGTDNIARLLATQRDLYRYMHDQTMRRANQGQTPLEIAEYIKLPTNIDTVWANRGYYGTLSHNAKSVFDYYLGGWFDGNPANLHPLPPSEAGAMYVSFMGGPSATLQKAKASYDKGQYRWAATVLNHLVFSDTTGTANGDSARLLLADTYEQLGYQAESGPWRNFYLTGAQELRYLNPPYEKNNKYPTNEVMDAMPLDQYLDFMAIHLVPERAGNKTLRFEVHFSDPDADTLRMNIVMQNSTINYKILPGNFSSIDPPVDAVVRLPRHTMNTIINYGPATGAKAMDEAIAKEKASIIGKNPKAWYEFIAMMDEFQFWFKIVTP